MYYNAYSAPEGMHTHTHSKAASLDRVTPRPDGEFLLFLGKRVRQLRHLGGMTRKMVAREADVSERHLAQREAGEGNVSIPLLPRIAGSRRVSHVHVVTSEV